MSTFGEYIRNKRETLFKKDKTYSQRQVSLKIGVEPSYLSKIERGQPVALSEEKIVALAELLEEDADFLLALGGKISGDVQAIIKKRPMLFSKLVREMKDLPDEAIEADKEFKQIHGKLQRLHDMAAIGAFEFNGEKDSSYWTNQVPTILGIPDDAAPCMDSILEALPPDARSRLAELQKTACVSQTVFQGELHLVPEGQAQKYIHIWGCVEAIDGSDKLTTIGIIQDVTEIVQLRNEIQSAKEALQETVDEQSVELSTAIKALKSEISSRIVLEEKLIKTNEGIVEQAAIQSAFFKDRAYNLRSLLNRHIAANSDTGNKPQSKLSLSRISSKINEMDDFFADGESLFYDESEFNLSDLLASIITEFENDFKFKQVSLSLFKSPDLPTVVISDKRRIEQIFTAMLELFLVNTPWGYVQISATYNTSKNDFVLSVTSPAKERGIDESTFYPDTITKNKAHVPNPAQQVGPLLDSIGGSLSIETTSGEGIMVNSHFPVKTATRKPKKEKPKTLKDKTALVVEDDQYSLIYMTKALESRGFIITSATRGNEALDKSKAQKFDVILLDIQLPDIDGIEVAKQIRQGSNTNADTPIIAVTAHATQADRHEYMTVGMNGFIPKPFELSTLSDEIFKLFEDII